MTMTLENPQTIVDFSCASPEELKRVRATVARILKRGTSVASVKYTTEQGTVTAPETVVLYTKAANGKYTELTDGVLVEKKPKNSETKVVLSGVVVSSDLSELDEDDDEDEELDDEDDEDDEDEDEDEE